MRGCVLVTLYYKKQGTGWFSSWALVCPPLIEPPGELQNDLLPQGQLNQILRGWCPGIGIYETLFRWAFNQPGLRSAAVMHCHCTNHSSSVALIQWLVCCLRFFYLFLCMLVSLLFKIYLNGRIPSIRFYAGLSPHQNVLMRHDIHAVRYMNPRGTAWWVFAFIDKALLRLCCIHVTTTQIKVWDTQSSPVPLPSQ